MRLLSEASKSKSSRAARSVQRPRSREAALREESALEPVLKEPAIAPAPSPSATSSSVSVEDVFGRLLPIWAGGIALAVSGFFLVHYSVEKGVLTPTVRVIFGFVFGGVLINVAEIAHRLRDRITDARVAQSLAGAGLATLYASFYLAGSGYALIGLSIAFAGLAAVTAAAILLSYRFGLPCAVLGLAGGFAAPLLAGGSEANVPMLATYLGLLTSGLVLAGEQQKHAEYGQVAVTFGLGWGVMLLDTPPGAARMIALGGYLILLGAVIPAVAKRSFSVAMIRVVFGGLATVQMTAIVAQGEFELLAWSLFALLSAALAFLGWRDARLRDGSAFAALAAVSLLLQWPSPPTEQFALVTGVLTAIFTVVPLVHQWSGRARNADFAVTFAFPLAVAEVIGRQFLVGDHGNVVYVVLAVIPGLSAWHEWFKGEGVWHTLAPLTSATILLTFASLTSLPLWAAPVVGCVAVAILTYLLAGRNGMGERVLVWSFAIYTLHLLGSTRLAGLGQHFHLVRGLLRWCAPTAAFALVSWREEAGWAAYVAESLTAYLAYGALSLVLPVSTLAWSAALASCVTVWWLRERWGARITLLVITALWAKPLLGQWFCAGWLALGGTPMLVGNVPSSSAALQHIAPFVAVLATVGIQREAGKPVRIRSAALIALPIAIILLHVLFKRCFAIASRQEFVALGFAERTIWEVVLGCIAIILFKWRSGPGFVKQIAICLATTALLHFGWFTLLKHNPLLSAQAVGTWPVANWLLPAYGVVVVVLLAASRSLMTWRSSEFELQLFINFTIMLLVTLLSISELRQAFAGSILTVGSVGQAEELLRSLLGIVLAVIFLVCGALTREQSWRAGSLMLMLLVVAKVFVLDAAGLEGLARVGSFMALGLSLIGIGWFCSRQLRSSEEL